ncbi:hypothetical protein SK128_000691 [Halocaridina rubra]|uniref:Uncharacterized protein n=1 Tax=Halocaridina rubra TaxID=373956 RepID=A0AAN9A978_HALRR
MRMIASNIDELSRFLSLVLTQVTGEKILSTTALLVGVISRMLHTAYSPSTSTVNVAGSTTVSKMNTDKLCERVLKLIEKPEEYLRPTGKLEKWVKQTRNIYNFVKGEESKYNLPSSERTISHLKTEGFDTEQIWQLLELQNKSVLAAPDDLHSIDEINLCFSVAKLSSLAKYDKLLLDEKNETEYKNIFKDTDSVLSKSSSDDAEEIDNESLDEKDEDEGMGSLENLEDDTSDGEMFKNSADIDGGLNLVFSDDSDKEVDNFDEFFAPQGMEDSDDDVDEKDFVSKMLGLVKAKCKKNEDISNKKEKEEVKHDKAELIKKSKSKKFRPTEVDSKFFQLRESEWIADQDMIGDNFDMDANDDVDLMKDISDGEGCGEENWVALVPQCQCEMPQIADKEFPMIQSGIYCAE